MDQQPQYTSRFTGQRITADAHIEQSIDDIVSTPIGSRIRRRDYGFPTALLDQPLNEKTVLLIYVAVSKALRKWEPRVTVHRFESEIDDGKLWLVIHHSGGVINTAIGGSQ